MRAKMASIASLKNQLIRNNRDRKIYRVTACGPGGITAYLVNEDGITYGPENSITWRAVKALYTILVPLEDIDDGKLAK
jgi:hypothetical protein